MGEQNIDWDMYDVHSVFGDVCLGKFHGPSIGDVAILTIKKKARFDVNIDKIDGENFSGTILTISEGMFPALDAEGLQRGQQVNFIHKNVCTFERRMPGSHNEKALKN